MRVRCPECGWSGERVSAGGECFVDGCFGLVVKGGSQSPRSTEGPRERLVVRVLPSTREALTSQQAASILDGVAKRQVRT